jgi:hypothetical protein
MEPTPLEFLYRLPPWGVSLALLAVLFAVVEIGFRAGRRTQARLAREASHGESSDGGPWLGTLQGAMLGLLGLILAFTYSFVSDRSAARKAAVVDEANAIGTAYLRADLAAEPGRSRLQDVLRRYTESRIFQDGREVGDDGAETRAALARTQALQTDLWDAVKSSVATRPATPIDALLVQSVNEVIDSHGRRIAAKRDHLPGLVLLMVFAVAGVSLATTGYSTGLSRRRSPVFLGALALIVMAIVYVILDLDHPRSGILRASQQSLYELREGMNPPAGQNGSK